MASSSAAPRRRLLVIVNPYATSVDRRLRELVIAALQSRYEVRAADTNAPGHARELAAEAIGSGVDAVATLGGDGTLNEAAEALVGTGIPLYPLPGGSQNVFAKLLGLPAEIVDSTARLLEFADNWETHQVDLGRANGRAFTFAAGVGLDASVVEQVDANPSMKARMRQWYYAQRGVITYIRDYLLRRDQLAASSGSEAIRGDTVLVQNGPDFTYAGDKPISLCSGVTLDCGTMSAAVLHLRSPLRAALTAVRLLTTSGAPTTRAITTMSGMTGLEVIADGGQQLPLQVDGDFAGLHSEVRFTLEPAALTVLAPKRQG